MAINNQRYETVYGSALFDELHNFFPELMYDEVIFPTEPFAWMRHRMTTLFPQGFTRQRSLYNITQLLAVPITRPGDFHPFLQWDKHMAIRGLVIRFE